MKKITLAFLISTTLTAPIWSQTPNKASIEPVGGEYVFNASHENCLTEAGRKEALQNIRQNMALLRQQNSLAIDNNRLGGGAHILFSWPIKKADGLNYNDVWSISGYLDHNAAYPNQLTDYNCGTKTYDTAAGYNHAGVDIFTWPFGWKMMDNDEAEIIAGADGQIIYKSDGQYDRSCSFNNNLWNAVYVQHSDGSVALYGHMKNGSLTTKNVGEMVSEGEYLGIVGSSGNSTGPHLHFEVYSEVELNGVGQDILVDPYTGSCNSLNPDSWWNDQKGYINPNINAVLTHSAPPVFPACPTTEITNESDQFEMDDTIYFALYMRDQVSGTNINLKIIRPNGTYLYNWTNNFTANYTASWWYWYYTGVFDMEGVWKWEATYQGETVTHEFVIGTLSVDDNTLETVSIFPNPVQDTVTIKTKLNLQQASICDVSGKQIQAISYGENHNGSYTLNTASLSNGMYFLTVVAENGKKEVFKLMKR